MIKDFAVPKEAQHKFLLYRANTILLEVSQGNPATPKEVLLDLAASASVAESEAWALISLALPDYRHGTTYSYDMGKNVIFWDEE